MYVLIFWSKLVWSHFWTIFFTNSSGHPALLILMDSWTRMTLLLANTLHMYYPINQGSVRKTLELLRFQSISWPSCFALCIYCLNWPQFEKQCFTMHLIPGCLVASGTFILTPVQNCEHPPQRSFIFSGHTFVCNTFDSKFLSLPFGFRSFQSQRLQFWRMKKHLCRKHSVWFLKK
jgi:hypothetical protein